MRNKSQETESKSGNTSKSSQSSLQVNAPTKPRIQRNLQLLHFLAQLTKRVLQLGDIRVDLLC